MDRIESSPHTLSGSITEELDRLEVLVSKIGSNTPGQSLDILRRLDAVYLRINELDESTSSHMQSETQFNGLIAHLYAEGRAFIRNVGGTKILRQARSEVQPPSDYIWWYIDEYVENKRRTQLRRVFITGGIITAVLAVIVILYQTFLAPDPQVAARYRFEQETRDLMVNGELDKALLAVEEGLRIAPDDPALRTLRGVILETQGDAQQAALDYAAAEKGFASREDFLVGRGQAYGMINQAQKALKDAQAAIEINPQSAQAYLLAGQIYEVQVSYDQALEYYDKAYEAADQTDQLELAAVARTRTAMLMQMINIPGVSSTAVPTETTQP